MNLLIDTHAALWLFNEHENLSITATEYMCNEENKLYISIVSAWEIAIKHSLGKLTEFPGGVRVFLTAIRENPVRIIAVLPEHVEKVEMLEYIHRDPFDRLIIATALCHNMAIITADSIFREYGVKCIW